MAREIHQLIIEIDSKDAARVVRRVKGELRELGVEAVSTEQRIDGMSAGVAKSFKGIALAAKALLGAQAGKVIKDFADRSVREFGQYETALVGVRKTTGLASREIALLGAEVRRMAREDVPIGSLALLEIAQSAGQLGVQGVDNILAFTEVVGKLGAASDLHGEEAAQTLARILNVQGEAPAEVERLASVLVELGNNSAATERQIARITNEISLATAEFRIGSTEAAALGAAAVESGIRAELAGSTIGRSFRFIQSAVLQGGDAMRVFSGLTGRSAEELREVFARSSTEAFELLLQGLRRVQDEGGSTSAVLDAMKLGGEEVAKVLPTLAANFERVAEKQALARGEAEDMNALNVEAAAAFDTLEIAIQRQSEQWLQARQTLGKELTPAYRELIDVSGQTAQTFTEVLAPAVGFLAEGFADLLQLADRTAEALSEAAVSAEGQAAPLGTVQEAWLRVHEAIANADAEETKQLLADLQDLLDETADRAENFERHWRDSSGALIETTGYQQAKADLQSLLIAIRALQEGSEVTAAQIDAAMEAELRDLGLAADEAEGSIGGLAITIEDTLEAALESVEGEIDAAKKRLREMRREYQQWRAEFRQAQEDQRRLDALIDESPSSLSGPSDADLGAAAESLGDDIWAGFLESVATQAGNGELKDSIDPVFYDIAQDFGVSMVDAILANEGDIGDIFEDVALDFVETMVREIAQAGIADLITGGNGLSLSGGSGSALGGINSAAGIGAIMIAAWQFGSAYLDRQQGQRFGAADIGTFGNQAISSSDGILGISSQLDAELKRLVDSMGLSIDSLGNLVIQASRDGKRFRTAIDGILVEFDNYADALEAGLRESLRHAVGDIPEVIQAILQTHSGSTEELIADVALAMDALGISTSELAIEFQQARDDADQLALALTRAGQETGLAADLYGQRLDEIRDRIVGVTLSEYERKLLLAEEFGGLIEAEEDRIQAEINSLLEQLERGLGLSLDRLETGGGRAGQVFHDAANAQLDLVEDLVRGTAAIGSVSDAFLDRISAQLDFLRAQLASLPDPIDPSEIPTGRPTGGRRSTPDPGIQQRAQRRAALREELELLRLQAEGATELELAERERLQTEERLREEARGLGGDAAETVEEIILLRREIQATEEAAARAEALENFLAPLRELAQVAGESDLETSLRHINEEFQEQLRLLSELDGPQTQHSANLAILGDVHRAQLAALGDQALDALGNPTRALRAEYDRFAQSVAFLRAHMTELGLTVDEVEAEIREFSVLRGLGIAEELARLTGDEETLQNLQRIRYELELQQMELEIQLLIERGNLLDQEAEFLLGLLANVREAGDDAFEIWAGVGQQVNVPTTGGSGPSLLDQAGAFLDGLAALQINQITDPVEQINAEMDALLDQAMQFAAFFPALGTSIEEVTADIEALRDARIEELFDRAFGSIRNLLDDLLLDNPNLNPTEQFQVAEARYFDLLARAQAGDLDAVNQLAGAFSDYQSLAASQYGTASGDYRRIYNEGIAALTALTGYDPSTGLPTDDYPGSGTQLEQLSTQQQIVRELQILNGTASFTGAYGGRQDYTDQIITELRAIKEQAAERESRTATADSRREASLAAMARELAAVRTEVSDIKYAQVAGSLN